MSDAMQTIYAGSRARLRKRQAGSRRRRSLGPRGPDIIYYLLCIIQIAIHPRLVILLASGLSHSLSYQLTQFNANGSTQQRRLHINYRRGAAHDKGCYGNSSGFRSVDTEGGTSRQNEMLCPPSLPTPNTFYFPEKTFGTSRGSSQMPSHKDPSSQINVISTNGDEITHTRDPSRCPDCHPPRERRKYTEIIKSHSGGSMAAHKFCSCHFRGCLSLPLFCSFLQ